LPQYLHQFGGALPGNRRFLDRNKLAAFYALVEELRERFSLLVPLTYEGFREDPAAGLRTVLEASAPRWTRSRSERRSR
jgi:hypothetical protein